MDKIEEIEEKGESNNNITEWNRLMKETDELERQLIPQLRIQERQRKEELQQEKVEKRQRRKLQQERDDNVNLKPQDQQLVKLAKQQQKENWHKAKKNHNMIKYMHYTKLATDQSNVIHIPLFFVLL